MWLNHLTLAEPDRFSLAARLVFAAILLSSLYLFWRRFGVVLGKILAAKKDPTFRLAPIAKRVWDFVSEVLFQSKVIRERPIPGLAHAFVFWGFLAFALVTLNHCALAFGLGFLSPEGLFGRFYFDFAALFAVSCSVGILSLFFRRFVLRPKWFGKKLSYESGFIALLIFTLMLTYLWAFFVPAGSTAASVLWWVHSLALFVFLPLIPHTKHLHLVLSPVTVFLSRGSFSQIPPLVGDEDFGLVAGADLTQIAALQVYSCVECGRCTEHCPAANSDKLLNPKEIILGLRGYLNEHGAKSDEPLLGKFNSQEAAFQCTTCGACEFQCPVGIEHLPLIVGLRRGAVNTGAWEDEHGGKLFLALERGSNALGISTTERDKFIQKESLPIFDGSQEYCLWLGCMGGYDPKGREIITAFARVMEHLGTSYGVLRKEKCCGDPVRRLGNDLVYQTVAEANLETFEQVGVKKVVSICPHCVRTISTDWKDFGNPPAVVEHHSEFLARHEDALKVATSAAVSSQTTKEKIVYHDPCYLSRYKNETEAPRTLVQIAGTLVEAPRSHERSFCCGAGGGLAFLGEESGQRISHIRATELVETGADTIGTACPFCNSMFRDALTTNAELSEGRSAPPDLLDIAQLIARNLPQTEAKPQQLVQ